MRTSCARSAPGCGKSSTTPRRRSRSPTTPSSSALVRAHEQQRAELWEGVLSGRAREPGFARDAALLLDVPADSGLLVVASPSLDRRRADERLSPHASAWVRRTEGVVGLVALRDDSPDDRPRDVEPAGRRGSRCLSGVSTVVAGFGGVHEGSGKPRWHCAPRARRRVWPRSDRRLPEAMLLSSPDLAAPARCPVGPPAAAAACRRGRCAPPDAHRLGRDRGVDVPHRAVAALPSQHSRQSVASGRRAHRHPARRRSAADGARPGPTGLADGDRPATTE